MKMGLRGISLGALLLLNGCGSDDSSRLVLGTANALIETDGGLQYSKPFTVQVTDSNGNGVPNAQVEISYTTVAYHKGFWQKVDTDTPPDGEVDRWQPNFSISCAAEDVNQNDVAEAGEDLDNDGTLEPTNSASITEHPSLTPTVNAGHTIITNEQGMGYFALTYPKTEANWVTLRVQARTDVSGSEYRELYDYFTQVLLEDSEEIDGSPPSGTVSGRYGVNGDCSDPL